MREPDRGMSREEKINLIGIAILIGFTASVFSHYINGFYHGLQYPHNTFLFDPVDRFNDFLSFYNIDKNLNPYFEPGGLRGNYYPFANVLFFLFTLFPPVQALFFFSAIFVVSVVCFNIAYLRSENKFEYVINVFIFSFLSYPFLFAFDRANLENLQFIFLALALLLYVKKRRFAFMIFLSCAIAMKAFPAVLLVLLLSERKFKETWYVCICVTVLSFISLLLHQGGFSANLNVILAGFDFRTYPVHGDILYGSNNQLQRGIALFSFFKIIFIQTGLINHMDMGRFLHRYVVSALVYFILLAAYIILIEKERWKKVTLLIFAMLLLPYISAEYKLLYVYIPIYFFINSFTGSRGDLFYAIMFSLLMIPKDYYIFPGIVSDSLLGDISIAVVLNVLIMVVMTLAIIVTGIVGWRKTGAGGVVR